MNLITRVICDFKILPSVVYNGFRTAIILACVIAAIFEIVGLPNFV